MRPFAILSRSPDPYRQYLAVSSGFFESWISEGKGYVVGR